MVAGRIMKCSLWCTCGQHEAQISEYTRIILLMNFDNANAEISIFWISTTLVYQFFNIIFCSINKLRFPPLESNQVRLRTAFRRSTKWLQMFQLYFIVGWSLKSKLGIFHELWAGLFSQKWFYRGRNQRSIYARVCVRLWFLFRISFKHTRICARSSSNDFFLAWSEWM